MKAISLIILLGLLITFLSVTINFIDDPIPAPGTSYRGLPLPWLKTRPMLAPVRQWSLNTLPSNSRFSPGSFIFDSLFWSGLAYCVIVLPMRQRTERIQNDRRRRGLCVKCGYNLAGDTTGVCPECGTKFELASKISSELGSPQRSDGV